MYVVKQHHFQSIIFTLKNSSIQTPIFTGGFSTEITAENGGFSYLPDFLNNRPIRETGGVRFEPGEVLTAS